MHGGWGLGMGFIWIPLLVALVIVVGVAIKGLGGREHGHPADHSPTPLEILKRRYASGEISQEEFERMRRDLV